MENINVINANKLTKYICRLKKSIKNNQDNSNKNSILNYYDHLKFNIQLGGSDNGLKVDKSDELNNVLNSLDKIILNITSDKTINSNLEIDFKKCSDDKKQLDEQNTKLDNELNELNSKLSECVENNKDLDKIIIRETENILSLNTKIDKLNEEKVKLENETKTITKNKNDLEQKLTNIEKLVSGLFGISGDIEMNIDQEIKIIKEKIIKYENIIGNILSNAEGKNLNETGQLEKYELALIDIKKRSDNAINLEKELEKTKKQNENLLKQIKSTDEIIKNFSQKNDEIIKLKSVIKDKDNDIKILTTQLDEHQNKINELENILNDKTTDMKKIALEFDNKIELLLNKIYGENSEIKHKILQGTK